MAKSKIKFFELSNGKKNDIDEESVKIDNEKSTEEEFAIRIGANLNN